MNLMNDTSQQQHQGIRSGNIVGMGGGTATTARTLADRLESAMSTVSYQCDRIESVLSKVNGTPRPQQPAGSDKSAIKVTAPLAQTVDFAEELAKRLCDLSSNLEQIA